MSDTEVKDGVDYTMSHLVEEVLNIINSSDDIGERLLAMSMLIREFAQTFDRCEGCRKHARETIVSIVESIIEEAKEQLTSEKGGYIHH